MEGERKCLCRPALEKTVSVLIWASILTSSFDIVLSFEVFGITVRATQLLAAAVMVVFFVEIVCGAKPRLPVSYGYLVIVLLFNTLWLYRARSLSNALGYDLWLAFDILEILAFSHYLSTYETLESLIRKYILCFDVLAAIGILQFFLQFADIRFFATQFGETPYGIMHRANGFTYEPSYYATYMLIGCAACLYLMEKRNECAMDKRLLCTSTALNTVALVLSTSRMGWLILAAYLVGRSALGLQRSVRKHTRNKTELAKLLAAPLLVLLLAGTFVIGVRQGNTLALVYTQGLGLGGDIRSSGPRLNALLDTWELFKSSPFMGVSLGGLDSEIAYNGGLSYTSELNGSFSMCVSAEALAAYGLTGAIFFFKYIYDTTIGCYRRIRTDGKMDQQQKQLVYALLLGHVLIFAALQLNQNILRQPYWAHLAVISAAQLLSTTKSERTSGKENG